MILSHGFFFLLIQILIFPHKKLLSVFENILLTTHVKFVNLYLTFFLKNFLLTNERFRFFLFKKKDK